MTQAASAAGASKSEKTAKGSILDHEMETLDGKKVNLAKKYKGKVVLLVNVASKCGNTKQYKPLEALHEKYGKEGLAIVGVPCNQFGGQEPGTAKEIA
jgi:glutathione peroxidase